MNTWKHQLNLAPYFHNDELTLAEKTHDIVIIIKTRSWFDEVNYNGELEDLLEEILDAGKEDNVELFDAIWDSVYDIFDAHRVWVSTR